MVCSRDIHAGLGDNTVLGGPIEIVVKCIIPCIGRTLRCAEIVEVCLSEGDDFTANFSIDKEIEGEVFVIEGVGPTEGVLGIHVAEVFVGLSIEFEWSSGLRVDNDFSGYFVSHKVDGIEVAIRTAFFEFDGSQPTLTIELPEKAFDTVKIDAGAGQMKLSDLTCENLDIDFGAGSSEVINVTCKNEADFDLGVGKTVFKDCTFNDSDFDCGVGETDFSGKLLGDAEIDGGIGSINFDIDGYKNDYKIKSNSKVKINSTTEENELLYKIKLDIDNGIGEISLNFR